MVVLGIVALHRSLMSPLSVVPQLQEGMVRQCQPKDPERRYG